jgi:hypothetical protein
VGVGISCVYSVCVCARVCWECMNVSLYVPSLDAVLFCSAGFPHLCFVFYLMTPVDAEKAEILLFRALTEDVSDDDALEAYANFMERQQFFEEAKLILSLRVPGQSGGATPSAAAMTAATKTLGSVHRTWEETRTERETDRQQQLDDQAHQVAAKSVLQQGYVPSVWCCV